MKKSKIQRINERALEILALTLSNAGCPAEDALLVRDAFWSTLIRKEKPAPKIYAEQSLFDVL